jgi:hypothetical protein
MISLSLMLMVGAPDCRAQSDVLARLADVVEAQYVLESAAHELAAQLRLWRKAGRYRASCGDEHAFIERLNRDLDTFDGHFHFEKAGAKDGEDWLMAWRAGAASANAGVREVSVMEGNIGYLRISSFYPWDVARDKYRAAWQLVGDVDGLIIDLRLNGGGADMPAAQIVRSALGTGIASVQVIEKRSGTVEEKLPAAELPTLPKDLPIVVIVDRRSASAAEYVAYSLQAAKRARVVGSRSGGAANMFGEPVPLGGDYQVVIPNARPVNRISRDNWEGKGVRPDIPGGDDPLFVARMLLAPPSAHR